jgi:hypothetical protein
VYIIVDRGIDRKRIAISLYDRLASDRREQIRDRVDGDSSSPLGMLINRLID